LQLEVNTPFEALNLVLIGGEEGGVVGDGVEAAFK
jgi:hypothetical protein